MTAPKQTPAPKATPRARPTVAPAKPKARPRAAPTGLARPSAFSVLGLELRSFDVHREAAPRVQKTALRKPVAAPATKVRVTSGRRTNFLGLPNGRYWLTGSVAVLALLAIGCTVAALGLGGVLRRRLSGKPPTYFRY